MKVSHLLKLGLKHIKISLKERGLISLDLRHTWASWHVQAGTPLNVLQELGGWSDYSMVPRYAHLSPEHLAKFCTSKYH